MLTADGREMRNVREHAVRLDVVRAVPLQVHDMERRRGVDDHFRPCLTHGRILEPGADSGQ
jgi:hypothetical protein